MKKFKYEFEVDDDFEVGDCYNCPFQEWEYYDDDGYTETYPYCVLSGSNGCPLVEVVEEEMVYCTKCKHLRINNEGNPTCPYEDICDITDCEDSRHRENRPCYEEISGNKQIN